MVMIQKKSLVLNCYSFMQSKSHVDSVLRLKRNSALKVCSSGSNYCNKGILKVKSPVMLCGVHGPICGPPHLSSCATTTHLRIPPTLFMSFCTATPLNLLTEFYVTFRCCQNWKYHLKENSSRQEKMLAYWFCDVGAELHSERSVPSISC